jgi:hypothetical protein
MYDAFFPLTLLFFTRHTFWLLSQQWAVVNVVSDLFVTNLYSIKRNREQIEGQLDIITIWIILLEWNSFPRLYFHYVGCSFFKANKILWFCVFAFEVFTKQVIKILSQWKTCIVFHIFWCMSYNIKFNYPTSIIHKAGRRVIMDYYHLSRGHYAQLYFINQINLEL